MQAIIYNPTSSPVANQVTSYRRSVEGFEYAGRNDVILYDTNGDPPSVKALIDGGVPRQYWKVNAGDVVEMSQAEKDSIVAQQTADALASKIATAKAVYVSDQDAQEKAHRAAIETVLELVVQEINILRAQHSLADRTAAQVKSAFLSTFQSKMDAITE